MRVKVVLAVCAVFLIASKAAAVLLFFDPFAIGSNPAAGEYTAGSVVGQNPTVGPTPFLTGPWVVQGDAPNVTAQAPGLNYLGAPAPGGSLISTPNGRPRRALSSPWSTTTTGTYYMSMMVNFGQGDYSDGIQDNDLGYRAIEFWQDTNGFSAANFAMGVQYANAIATARMSFDLNGQRTVIEGSPGGFLADGVTHLLVLKLNLSNQPLADSISLYLDPTSTTEPGLPGFFASGIDFNLAAMGGVTIFGGSGIGPSFDELRVGTQFIDVLPSFPVPGDTDGDGDVDLVDFQHIFDGFNKTGQDTLHGDVALSNGQQGSDGKVDLGDFHLWKTHFPFPGAGSGSFADGSVPEPATIVLAAIGLMLTMRPNFRRALTSRH